MIFLPVGLVQPTTNQGWHCSPFSRVKDPLLRRVLELRFGADQGGHRRSPAEVAEVLGGKYAGKAETALMLIRQALRSLIC